MYITAGRAGIGSKGHEPGAGRKTVILNAPALAVYALEHISAYVIPGDDSEKPRHDLQRSWDVIIKQAGLSGVRLRDALRELWCRWRGCAFPSS